MASRARGEASVLSGASKSAIKASMNLELDEEQGGGSSSNISGDSIYEKYVFPIVAEANRTQRVNAIVRCFEFFYIFTQILISGYQDFNPSGYYVNPGYVIFLKVVFIGFIGESNVILPFFYMLMIIDFLTFLIFAIAIVDYQINHEYRKWILWTLRNWHGHIFGIFLIPNIMMIFKSVSYLGKYGDVTGYVILILAAIMSGYSFWHYLIILPFFSRSPYLSPSPVHAWNIKNCYTMLVVLSIPMGIQVFLNNDFKWYFELVPVILLFIVNGVAFLYLYYFPFKGVLVNAICYCAVGNSFIGSGLTVAWIVTEVPDNIFYSTPTLISLALAIVMYFVLLRRRNNIVKSLNYASFCEDGIRPTEDVKKDHFLSLNFKTFYSRLMYIQIGFENMCDLSADWSLQRYLSEICPDDDGLLVFLCWIVSLFPSEIHFLHGLLTLEGKIPQKRIDDRCLIFQVHRIHIFRQSSASREASSDFSKVSQLTTSAINIFCRFWSNLANPNIEFDENVFSMLSIHRQQADAAWSESLDKYPNNPRFVNEYSRYLLDCCCMFKKAAIIHQRAVLLDSGAKLINDRSFHHFVRTFPTYLKKGIVDAKGTLKGPRKMHTNDESNSNSTSVTHSSSANGVSSNVSDLSNDEDSSENVDMNESAKYLPQAALRLALERAVNDLKSPIISKITISSIVRLFLTIAYVVVIVAILAPSFDHRKNLFNIFKILNYAEHNISLMSIQVPFFFYEGTKLGNVDYSPLIRDMEPQIHTIESLVNFSQPIRKTINRFALLSLESLNDLASLLYNIDLESSSDLLSFQEVYLIEKKNSYVCAYNNGIMTPFSEKQGITLDYLIRTFITTTRILTMDNETIRKDWGTNSSDFCEQYFNQPSVLNGFKSINGAISKNLHNIFNQLNDTEVSSASENQNVDAQILEVKEKIYKKLQTLRTKESKTPIKTKSHHLLQRQNHHNHHHNNNQSINQIKKGDDINNTKLRRILDKEIYEQNKKIKSDETSNDGSEDNMTEEEVLDPIDKTCDFFTAFSPFIIAAFILPSVVFLSSGLSEEITVFSKILRSVPRPDCIKGSEPILKNSQTSSGATRSKDKNKSSVVTSADGNILSQVPLWIFNVISAIIIIVLVIALSLYTKDTRVQLDYLTEFFASFAMIRGLLFDACREITYLHMINEDPIHFNSIFNITEISMRLILSFTEYSQILSMVNLDNEIMPSAISLDRRINEIRFNPICDHPIKSNRHIDVYECISLDRTISYFNQLFNSITSLAAIKDLPESVCPYMAHMLDTRISVGFIQLMGRIEELYYNMLTTHLVLIIVVAVITIFFVLIGFVFELWISNTITKQLDVFKSLMLRLNPISFVSNPQLLSLVYGKANSIDNHIVSAAHAVFMTSHDAMISLNDECVIESINPSATTIFGYTPEQMLGQNIKILINSEVENNSQLFYTMQLMKSGQSALIYESEISGKKDDETTVPLKVTLLGFSSNDRMAESFGLMCRDQTLEMKQKSAVEEAKKQSENLLLQILPKDIIMRLNRGDTDISFSVPSATIVFIDIEKFSNYSASLSASEIMTNLGMVFTAYDNFLHKYSLLIKIKLIGDDYMAAAGLFNPDSEPKEHAEQVVQFALECLDAIEELNEQLNASLQVRIGVNTNGPLIAGVLGTDKPLFDIIGDPINVAARLQSTDIPGYVQISQATYEKIANCPHFHIEQRGEVELKGKGKQMTYLVHPNEEGHSHANDNNDVNNSTSGSQTSLVIPQQE